MSRMVRAKGPWLSSAGAVGGAGTGAEGARPLGHIVAGGCVGRKARAGFTGLCRLRASLVSEVNLFFLMLSGGEERGGLWSGRWVPVTSRGWCAFVLERGVGGMLQLSPSTVLA